MTEGLFDGDPAEGRVGLLQQPGLGQLFDDRAEKARRDGKIEGRIAGRRLGDLRLQRRIDIVLGEVAADIGQMGSQRLPRRALLERALAALFGMKIIMGLAQGLVVARGNVDADDR